MFAGKIDPVHRRNALLITAAVLLTLAIIRQPALLWFFTSARECICLALTALAALWAAIGIYHLATAVFGTTALPWYTRRGALVFLVLALLAINAALLFVGNLLSHALSTDRFIIHDAYRCKPSTLFRRTKP